MTLKRRQHTISRDFSFTVRCLSFAQKILLLSLLLGLLLNTLSSAFGQPGKSRTKDRQSRKGKIVNITGKKVTIRDDAGNTLVITSASVQRITQHIITGPTSFSIGSPVLIQGPVIGDRVKARVFLLLQPEDYADVTRSSTISKPFAKKIGVLSSVSPLVIQLFQTGQEIAVDIEPNTFFLREKSIKLADLVIGDYVRTLPGKLVKLPPREELQSQQAISLPNVPAPDKDRFNADTAQERNRSPFGIFDPNMLRFHHLKVYKSFPKTMRDLDMHWAAFGATFSFNWNLLQDDRQSFHWERTDRLIGLTQASNIHVVGYIKANKRDDSPRKRNRHRHSSCLPKDMGSYKRFVSAVVERYDGDGINDMPGLKLPIKYWSIEDEPMAPVYFAGTGADYAQIVYAASRAIRSADPDAKIILSMIRGTGWLKKAGNPRKFMLSFFEELAQLTKIRPYDILDQHWIGTAPGIPQAKQYAVYEQWLLDLEKTALHYGFSKAPVVNLEMAGSIVSETEQALDLVKRHVFLLGLGVQKIFWSGIKAVPGKNLSHRDKHNYFRQAALIDGDDRRKSSYYAYKLLISQLDGSDWSKTKVLKKNQEGSFVYTFQKNGAPIWVLWNDSQAGKEYLNIPEGIKSVVIIPAIPKPGASLSEGAPLFQKVKNGKVVIKTDNIPLFVVGNEQNTDPSSVSYGL